MRFDEPYDADGIIARIGKIKCEAAQQCEKTFHLHALDSGSPPASEYFKLLRGTRI